MLMDIIHVILSPIKLAIFGIAHYLVPKSFPQNLLNHKLIVPGAYINSDSRWIGVAERQISAEPVCELHFEVEIELYFQFLHIGFLVMIGVHAERFFSLKGLQLHVAGSLLGKIFAGAISTRPRGSRTQLSRHWSICLGGTINLLI